MDGDATYLAIARRKLVELRQSHRGQSSEPVAPVRSPRHPDGEATGGVVARSNTATKYEINELNELSSPPSCPSCGEPLTAFDCCWRCRGRLCQACGAWMRGQPYAIACAECLQAGFARLTTERRQAVAPADQTHNPRLHVCPGCAAQGRQKLIPTLWQHCAVCEAPPVVVPLDPWDAEIARTLIQATVRRVDVAWGAIPAEQRDPALGAHLGGTALAPIEAARQRRDMMGLRRALATYEAEAAPLFEACRSRTEVSL